MTERCNRCRFWRADEQSGNFDDHPFAYGECRRYPPRVSDHLASLVIGSPRISDYSDMDVVVTRDALLRSCPLPVTFFDDWCGEFAAPTPAVPL